VVIAKENKMENETIKELQTKQKETWDQIQTKHQCIAKFIHDQYVDGKFIPYLQKNSMCPKIIGKIKFPGRWLRTRIEVHRTYFKVGILDRLRIDSGFAKDIFLEISCRAVLNNLDKTNKELKQTCKKLNLLCGEETKTG
jgi:hypothetical protein